MKLRATWKAGGLKLRATLSQVPATLWQSGLIFWAIIPQSSPFFIETTHNFTPLAFQVETFLELLQSIQEISYGPPKKPPRFPLKGPFKEEIDIGPFKGHIKLSWNYGMALRSFKRIRTMGPCFEGGL